MKRGGRPDHHGLTPEATFCRPSGAKDVENANGRPSVGHRHFCFCDSFAHESFSDTARLKTSLPPASSAFESGSTQK